MLNPNLEPWQWATVGGMGDPVELVSRPFDNDGIECIKARIRVGDPASVQTIPTEGLVPINPKEHPWATRERVFLDGSNTDFVFKDELEAVKMLRLAGCDCEKTLLGYRPGVGPRCRSCNTEVQTESRRPRKELALTASQITGVAREFIAAMEMQMNREPSESYRFDWGEDYFNVWGSNGFHCFGIKEPKDGPDVKAEIEDVIGWLESRNAVDN